MDQKISDEEQAEIITKMFNCTESPIKEWIATFLDAEVKYVFTDYVDNSDVIGFQENDKHYNAYVVTLNHDTTSQVNPELLKNSEKTRKACSILYDAVYKVFPSVAPTCSDEYLNMVVGLRPIFDEKTMSFKLFRINGKSAQLQLALEQKYKIMELLSKSESELTIDQKAGIDNSLKKIDDIIKNNTKQVLDDDELICNLTNNKLETYDKLYIVVEECDENNQENMETSMRRLPVFGLSYQDPDEETYIDKLKKEYTINE